jgi:phage shock protein A
MARGQSDADFERVNTLVAGGMKKMQAFAAVAEERGVSANGVRVNYYNESRRANSSSAKPSRTAGRGRPAKRRPPRSVPGVVASNGAASIDDLAARLVANIQALATAVGEQNRELTELQDRVDRVRDPVR